MWRPVYYIAVSLSGFMFLPLWLLRSRRKGRGAWPLLRMGLRGQNLRALPAGGIWIHALSVGEVASALPLARALQKTGLPVYFSVATITGYNLAQRELPGAHILVRPLDVPWVVAGWLRSLKPRLFILVESDMWPAWQRAVKQAGVKSALVNARISPRSLAGYLKCPPAARLLYKDFDLICVQSELDSQRLRQIGIGNNVKALGNLKFDSLPAPPDNRRQLAADLGLPGRVIVCGSTHEGEEQACIAAWQSIGQGHCLVIAPRDVKRARKILDMLPQAWLASWGAMPPGRQVLVLDVMGQLARVYALAEVAFIGGSLVPQGGHNPLEAAVQGVPVTFGPHMEDFALLAQNLLEAGAGRMVRDAQDLSATWRELLADRCQAKAMGRQGREFCLARQGACQRIIEMLEPFYA